MILQNTLDENVFQLLTGIFGVGAKTADRWIRMGIYDLHQLQFSGQTLNEAQQAGLCLCLSFVSALGSRAWSQLWIHPLVGLEHYGDLNQPVTKAEADAVGEIVRKVVLSVLPGAQLTLIGGFRRYPSTLLIQKRKSLSNQFPESQIQYLK